MKWIILVLALVVLCSPVFALQFDIYPLEDKVELLPDEVQFRTLTIYNYEMQPLMVEARSTLFKNNRFVEVPAMGTSELKYPVHGFIDSANATFDIELNLRVNNQSAKFIHKVLVNTVIVKQEGDSCSRDSDCMTGSCILQGDGTKKCGKKASGYLVLGGKGESSINLTPYLIYGSIGFAAILVILMLLLFFFRREKKFLNVLNDIRERLE